MPDKREGHPVGRTGRTSPPAIIALILLALLAASAERGLAQERYDVIIRNGRVLDGSGNPWRRADVALRGDRIAAVGDLSEAQADREIDAAGLYHRIRCPTATAYVSSTVRP